MAWDISKILIEHCPKTTLKSMLELIVAFKVLFFIIVGQLYSQDEKKKTCINMVELQRRPDCSNSSPSS